MKIFNVDTLDHFKNLNFNSQNELLEFFSKFNEKYYIENNIYYELHHVIPRCETECETKDLIPLPVKYHFLVHYLRGKEYELKNEKKFAYKNYLAAFRIVGFNLRKINNLDEIINENFYKMKEKAVELYGIKVICLQTLKIYDGIHDAERDTKNSRDHIRKCCRNNGIHTKYSYNSSYMNWVFYDDTKSNDFYISLLEEIKNKPKEKKKKWTEEAYKKRADKIRGTHYITKRSYKIKDLELNKIYNSLSEALRETGFQKKRMYRWLEKGQRFIKLI